MDKRDLYLLECRPIISSAKIFENMNPNERFQNKTLRPIVKLQSDLLLMAFKNYIGKHKIPFYELSVEKRMLTIENSIQKDTKFRNSLKGMVIGQFTLDEYELYIRNSSALNKRMMGIVIDLLQGNIQLLAAA